MKTAPWNTTRAYISAVKGKCLLDLNGPADRSFLKDTMRNSNPGLKSMGIGAIVYHLSCWKLKAHRHFPSWYIWAVFSMSNSVIIRITSSRSSLFLSWNLEEQYSCCRAGSMWKFLASSRYLWQVWSIRTGPCLGVMWTKSQICLNPIQMHTNSLSLFWLCVL